MKFTVFFFLFRFCILKDSTPLVTPSMEFIYIYWKNFSAQDFTYEEKVFSASAITPVISRTFSSSSLLPTH